MESAIKLSQSEKNKLRDLLYLRDGGKCHYCGIEEEEFCNVWGKYFYGGIKRGRVLEIDHKNNDSQNNNLDNLVLACALCNMAKSDKIKHDEFIKVGEVIREIWKQRKKSGIKPK